MKTNEKSRRMDKIRLTAIVIISVLVIATGAFFSYGSFKNGEVTGGILGIIIALIILAFAIIVYKRGKEDLKKGFPLKDERSKRVMEKAMSMAFLVSIYMLLAIGFLSDSIIKFRDVSQATGVSIGIMAILFLIFWVYYNRKEI